MSHPSSEELSAYVDGELPELEAHLAGCAECRAGVAELRRVRDWLRGDAVRPSDAPTKTEWRAIARRIKQRRVLRIGAALLAAAAIGAVVIGRSSPPQENPRSVYIQVSADLEGILRDNRARLRPETVRALERSLTVIDSALAQAEQALAADPANDYVIRSIDQLHNQRLATLRLATQE